MKRILCMLVLSVSAMVAQAEGANVGQDRNGGPGEAEQFSKIKSKIVEIKQKQLNGVRISLQCAEAAKNRDALHFCHEQDRKEHEEMRAQMEKIKEGAKSHSGEHR